MCNRKCEIKRSHSRGKGNQGGEWGEGRKVKEKVRKEQNGNKALVNNEGKKGRGAEGREGNEGKRENADVSCTGTNTLQGA